MQPLDVTRRFALALSMALAITSAACSQTSYPMLMSLHPASAQIGATTEHTIQSRYSMFGASAVIVTGDGVTGEIVHPEVKDGEKPSLTSMKVKFTVAPDALPGVRDFRLLTPNGVSTLGQLVVSHEAVVVEAKTNDPATPQKSPAPATWCGVIEKAEDVDSYQFSATKGQSLTFHVRSMRLQNKIHDLQQHSDPIITLRNSAGSTLATSDNYFYGDPFLAHTFAADGEYSLEIRDVRYQGNKYWVYSIEVSERPFVTNAHPLAVELGKPATLELVGHQLGNDTSVEFTTATDLPLTPAPIGIEVGGHTLAIPLAPTKLPVIVEAGGDNNTLENAATVTAPAVISGRLESESDIDCYRLTAKKGEAWSFELLGRRSGSGIDSHLRVLDAKGKQLQLNDDMKIGKRNSSDSWIENWVAPADGDYIVEVRDLHLRGGPHFVYALEVTRAAPYFELYLDTDKTLLTPGTSAIIYVRAVKKNGFDGEIELAIDGLPEGVTASCGRILAGKPVDGCIVLTAAPDAKPVLANVTVTGSARLQKEAAEPLQLSASALPYQETYQPGGGRGHYPVELHTVSVGEPSDIRAVRLSTYDITMKPGESVKVDVEIERAEGFDKNVSLDVIYKHLSSVYGNSLPEGVTLDGGASKILLTKGATQGHITLKAAADAKPVEKQQIAVMANVSLNFVMKATYCSEPLLITLSE